MKPIGSQRFDARCSANGRPGAKTTLLLIGLEPSVETR